MFDARTQEVIDHVDSLRHRLSDHWQIPADEALLLAQLVRIGRCESICEVGTSYGFSTLHLAAAVRDVAGIVNTFDIHPLKTEAATIHLKQAGLIDHVTLHTGDARELLKAVTPAKPYDFVFIDAVKSESFDYLKAVWPRLAARAIIVTDNTTTHAKQLAPFVKHLRSLRGISSCGVPVGNGFELSIVQAN